MIFHSIEDNRRNKDYFARKDNSTCERLLLIIGGISSAQCIITRLTIFLFPSFPRARSFSVITRFFEDDTHRPPLLESSRMNLNEIRVEFESSRNEGAIEIKKKNGNCFDIAKIIAFSVEKIKFIVIFSFLHENQFALWFVQTLGANEFKRRWRIIQLPSRM